MYTQSCHHFTLKKQAPPTVSNKPTYKDILSIYVYIPNSNYNDFYNFKRQSLCMFLILIYWYKDKEPLRAYGQSTSSLLRSNAYLVSRCRLYSYTTGHYGKAPQGSPGWTESPSSKSFPPEEAEGLGYHLGTFPF